MTPYAESTWSELEHATGAETALFDSATMNALQPPPNASWPPPGCDDRRDETVEQ